MAPFCLSCTSMSISKGAGNAHCIVMSDEWLKTLNEKRALYSHQKLVDFDTPLLCMKGSSTFVPHMKRDLELSQSHTFTAPVVLFARLKRHLTFDLMAFAT